MPKFEQFGRHAITYLIDAINNSVTSLKVADPSQFPSDGNFRITVGTEIMLVTAVSGDIFTIVRGSESTSAQAHDGGARVVQSLTAGGLEQVAKDSIAMFRDTNRPVLNKLVNDTGTVLTSSSFTWANQGSATSTDLNSGGVALVCPAAASDNLRVRYKTINSAPNKLTVGFIPQLHADSTCHVGIGFRENSTGKLMVIASAKEDELAVYKFTSPTVFSANLFARQSWFMGRSFQWFQIEDNNTNLFFRTSMDGINFQTIASEARTTFMAGGPDEVCFYGNTNNASFSVSIAVIAWEEE